MWRMSIPSLREKSLLSPKVFLHCVVSLYCSDSSLHFKFSTDVFITHFKDAQMLKKIRIVIELAIDTWVREQIQRQATVVWRQYLLLSAVVKFTSAFMPLMAASCL